MTNKTTGKYENLTFIKDGNEFPSDDSEKPPKSPRRRFFERAGAVTAAVALTAGSHMPGMLDGFPSPKQQDNVTELHYDGLNDANEQPWVSVASPEVASNTIDMNHVFASDEEKAEFLQNPERVEQMRNDAAALREMIANGWRVGSLRIYDQNGVAISGESISEGDVVFVGVSAADPSKREQVEVYAAAQRRDGELDMVPDGDVLVFETIDPGNAIADHPWIDGVKVTFDDQGVFVYSLHLSGNDKSTLPEVTGSLYDNDPRANTPAGIKDIDETSALVYLNQAPYVGGE